MGQTATDLERILNDAAKLGNPVGPLLAQVQRLRALVDDTNRGTVAMAAGHGEMAAALDHARDIAAQVAAELLRMAGLVEAGELPPVAAVLMLRANAIKLNWK